MAVAIFGGRLLVALIRALSRVGVTLCKLGFRYAGWSLATWRRALIGFGVALVLALLAIDLLLAALAVVTRAVGEALDELGRRLAELGSSLPPVELVIDMLVLAVAAWWGLRLYCTWRTAQARETWAVLPPLDWEVTPGALAAFAQVLLGMRRRVLRKLDLWATGFRVELTTTADGRPVYLWQCPARFRSVLATVISCYPGLELRPAAELIGEPAPQPPDGARPHVVRLGLRTSRPDRYSLREVPQSRQGGFDPLQPFGRLLAGVHPELGERLSVVLDLLPVAPREVVRLRRRMLRRARSWERRDWLMLRQDRHDSRNPAEGLERAIEREALAEKFEDSPPLFRARFLVRAESWNPERAQGLVRAAQTCFEQWAGQNYLRAVGLPLGGITVLGANTPGRRGLFDLCHRSGLMLPGQGRVLTRREVWGFLKPWLGVCAVPTAVRQSVLDLPPPADAPSEGMVICLAE